MNGPVVMFYGMPVTCSLEARGKMFTLSGVMDHHDSLLIQAGSHPLPLDCLVYVHAGVQEWVGYLSDEKVWEDGTLTYTLRL